MSVLGRTANALIGAWLALAVITTPAAARQAESTGEGWVKKRFDFGAEDLAFEAAVPADASVKTTTMPPREAGTLGRIMIVGKIYPAKAGTPVEVTIQAFDLMAPAAASRVCAHEAEIAGYTLRARRAEPDLSDAELFAKKSDENRPIGGVFSRCMTRGNKMLVTHFLFDVSGVTDKDELDVRANQAQDYYKTFISSIVFADGHSPGYRNMMREIPVTIGADKTTLSVPDVWQVPINDFHGHLPAELHLLRKNNSGEDTGLLWLAVQERKEQPDLEKLGPTLIGDYFIQQWPDAERPVLLQGSEDPDMLESGVVSRSFRFSAKNKAGEDIGEILATLIWHDGRLYVLSLWSRWAPAADRNTFFSRLPGLTAYDLISAKLVRTMTESR
ncbi:hypothetical protein G6N74_30075 [Mesorhizobium sp. CGMCC 1.15528]|uniref:Uncharacterized protein n=1 Tax=Mesorhizobium zhangyense TaxID=1776730 RepID=A0A7C9RBY7_9HYPH|nr:hypothetical protein [Mesorhizobium zhangyense]NGN45302.1 hypothetical protein [Mesorhizobium zhangyense]